MPPPLSVDAKGHAEPVRTDLLHHLLDIANSKGRDVGFGTGEVEYEAYVAMYGHLASPFR
jgi:hypothetical protein